MTGDETLAEDLEASISQFVTMCDGARYGVMLDYHQLKSLERFPDHDIRDQVGSLLVMAEKDHDAHVRRGTCVQVPPPSNERNREWRR